MDSVIVYLSLIPAILWIAYFYYQDKYEKESLKMIVWVFFLGCLSVIPALIIELAAGEVVEHHIPFGWVRILITMLVVGFAEEWSKYLAVRKGVYFKEDFNEPMDGIVYCVTAAMGFAFVENIFYMVSSKYSDGFFAAYSLGVLRGIFSMFGHASFGVIMGSYMGRAKFTPDREKVLLWQGFVFASLVHALYNFALSVNRVFLAVIPLLVSFLLMWRNMNRVYMDNALEQSPFKPEGTVTQPGRWKWGAANVLSILMIAGVVAGGVLLFDKPVVLKNRKMGYEISHPSYWKRRANNSFSIIEFRAPAFRGADPTIRIETRTPDTSNLDEYLTKVMGELSGKLSNLEKMWSKPIEIDGKRGILVKVRWDKDIKDKGQVVHLSYIAFIPDRERMILFTTETLEDQFKTYDEKFLGIIKSFRVTEAK